VPVPRQQAKNLIFNAICQAFFATVMFMSYKTIHMLPLASVWLWTFNFARVLCHVCAGPPREILQDETRLLLGPWGQTETYLKMEDKRSNKNTGKLSSMLYFLCNRMSRKHILYTNQ
jgi:hypothetical protein